jgi:PTH1 family peptidyl-tRNA hydrolase
MGKGSSFGRTFFLVKPLTFMNRSGEIVKTVLREAKASISDLVIVCDNLDLATGVLKLKPNGSSGGHRGLESIFYSLKTDEIMRLSIGIGRPNRRGAVVDHVLGEPDKEESMILEGAVEKAAFFILRLLTEPKEKVMGDVNRRVKNDGQA